MYISVCVCVCVCAYRGYHRRRCVKAVLCGGRSVAWARAREREKRHADAMLRRWENPNG